MTCLKDETLAALARGVIPQGELVRIRAHLPECPRCLDAIARRSGSSLNPGDARRWAPPSAPPAPPSQAAGRYRWLAVIAAMLTVALSAFWVAMPAGSARAGADSAARAVAGIGAEARQVWRAMRGVVGSSVVSEADATTEATDGTAPEGAASAPSPATLLRDDAAASARVAEASRLVERANEAAALNQAAGGQ